MRVLRANEYRVMPWKNGGGTTTEIAVFPEGAGLDTFEWRVSMARVETDGPFSGFPGVDRTLAVLEGRGIALEVKGAKPVELDATSQPYAFAADVQTRAALVGGPITDLNVMTRRGVWRHTVERLSPQTRTSIVLDSEVTLVLLASGRARLRHGGMDIDAMTLDCAIFERHEEPAIIDPDGAARLFMIRLDRVR